MLRWISAGVAIATVFTCGAAQADPATYNWTGFYVGGYAGYGWGKSTATDAGNGSIPWYDLNAKFSNHAGGFIGGGQAGYNYQSGNWVAGLEADYGYLGLKGNGLYADSSLSDDTYVKTNAAYDATFRIRFGVTNGPALFYVTGGAILANFNSYVQSFSPHYTDKTNSQWGWTIGAGVEYALNQKWSVKAEYLYYDAGSENVFLNNNPPHYRFPIENAGNLYRLGLNYRFGAN